MPNRILRDWTDSEKVNVLSWQAECFFTRLIMKVDDYGRFSGNPKLLKALLFPLKDGLRDADISRWMAECQKAGILRVYKFESKPFIEIENFKQRTRSMASKFPSNDSHMTVICQTDDRQMTALFGDGDGDDIKESKPKKTEGEPPKVSPISTFAHFKSPNLEEIKTYCFERNNTIDAQKFFDFYQAKGWMIGKNKMKDWKAAVRTWEQGSNQNKPINHYQSTNTAEAVRLSDELSRKELF